MMHDRLTVVLALSAVLAGAAPIHRASAQDEAGAPALIAMFHEGAGSHESGQMRSAAESWEGLAVIDEYAPGAGNPVYDADVDLGEYDLVFVEGADSTPLTEAEIADARERTRLMVLNPQGAAFGNVSLDEHADVALYWTNRSVENDRALAAYLAVSVLGRPMPGPGEVPPPVEYPRIGLYHPDAAGLFDDADALLDWYAARDSGRRYDPGALTLGVVSHRSDYQRQTTNYVDAMIRATERRGHNAFALLYVRGTDLTPLNSDDGPLVDVLLFTGEHLDIADMDAGIDQARRLGVPILSALDFYQGTAEDYRESPGGLSPGMKPRIVAHEIEGIFEPMAVAANIPGSVPRRREVMPEQVEWRVERALGWAALRRMENADKRLALTFWSEAGGKSDVGGDPDDFLDVPGTLATLLPTLRERGYDVGDGAIPDSEGFANLMAREASNVGGWAPGELARRIETDHAALIPEEAYLAWYAEVPELLRARIEEMWGPPPGEVMTHVAEGGERMIVIPKIEFGNILVAPNPMWGYLENEQVLLSIDALPPHHQYLAFFLWLRREWGAHAWISLFTNFSLQLGKSEGPLVDDAIGVMLGGMPHIHPERLGAAGGIANRRKAMAATPGWYNVVSPSDAHLNLAELRGMVARYRSAADEAAREAMAPTLRENVVATGVNRALGLDVISAPMEDLLAALDGHFGDLERANAPWGGKILGQAPQGDVLAAMVAGMLGDDLRNPLEALGGVEARDEARELVAAVLEGASPLQTLEARFGGVSPDSLAALASANRFAALLYTAPREVESIMEALEGRWIEPGPMGEPYRRPDVLPAGRAIYMVDPRTLPTVEAEDIGVRQAEALIAAHREENGGEYPDSLAFVVWSTGITKDYGVTEAQILHLLGTRVTRNWRGEVTGVELIPREELDRPRVDVLVQMSGVYRDHFPEKADLMTAATRLAAASPEADNPVRSASEEIAEDLIDAGEDAGLASQLSTARVFSSAPGAYSPSIQFLAKSGDQRGDTARMADLYTRRMGHAYGGGLYGEYSRPAYESNLERMDAATLPRNSDVNGLLDHPMTAAFLGGLNLASKALTGEDSDLYISNLRDLDDPRIETAAAALQTELRARYFNPRWLMENQAHGYDGARNFMFLTDHLDLWDSTATEVVASADWAEVKAVFVDDVFDLDMDAFFDRHNPFAHQMLMTNLLGAAQRGDWEATAEELAQIARRLTHSVIDHGPACEPNQCRNQAMTEFVGQALGTARDAAPLLAGYTAAIADAVQAVAGAAPGAGEPPTVTGQVMEEVALEPFEPAVAFPMLWLMLGAFGILLFGVGWVRGG